MVAEAPHGLGCKEFIVCPSTARVLCIAQFATDEVVELSVFPVQAMALVDINGIPVEIKVQDGVLVGSLTFKITTGINLFDIRVIASNLLHMKRHYYIMLFVSPDTRLRSLLLSSR